MIKIFFVITLISIAQSTDYNNKIDSLSMDNSLHYLNKKHNTILGRDKDPKVYSDISTKELWIRKTFWTLVTIPGLRFLTNIIYPNSTISHFNVENSVAFTIDDGFCGVDNKGGCMIEEVKELFKSYNAHATFFIAGSHCNNVAIKDVNLIIDDGHEISNHNMMDWSYQDYSIDEFEFDLNLTKDILSSYKQEYSSWYRAPFGRLSKNMQMVIDRKRLIHVLPDIFANDTYIPDPNWISEYILKRVKPGSIILIHMPEIGVREWNYEAMKLTLQGLKEKNLKVLNLTEIKLLQNETVQ